MLKQYEIKHEPVIPGSWDGDGNFIPSGNGKLKDKWNVYYYHDGVQYGPAEFYSYDGVTPAEGCSIREGYVKKVV